jgi:hypothetical protein
MIDGKGITSAFDPDVGLMFSAYESTDDIGKVLRVHLMLEQQIEKLITSQSNAKVDRTTFWSKVNLMRAMGVPESICIAAEALNELRNQFAHNSKATIANTKSKSDAFLKSASIIWPKLPEATGNLTKTKSGIEHKLSYAKASQAQRVVIAGFILSNLIGALPKMYRLGKPLRLLTLAGTNL